MVLDKFNDISSSTGMLMGTVTIDTLGEVFNVGVDKKQQIKYLVKHITLYLV